MRPSGGCLSCLVGPSFPSSGATQIEPPVRENLSSRWLPQEIPANGARIAKSARTQLRVEFHLLFIPSHGVRVTIVPFGRVTNEMHTGLPFPLARNCSPSDRLMEERSCTCSWHCSQNRLCGPSTRISSQRSGQANASFGANVGRGSFIGYPIRRCSKHSLSAWHAGNSLIQLGSLVNRLGKAFEDCFGEMVSIPPIKNLDVQVDTRMDRKTT